MIREVARRVGYERVKDLEEGARQGHAILWNNGKCRTESLAASHGGSNADHARIQHKWANGTSVGESETFEKVDRGNNRFALKSLATGKFVCAEDAGASILIANRDVAAEWETFEQVDLGSRGVALKALANGRLVSATPSLMANSITGGVAETFEKIERGDHRIALKSIATQKFVAVDDVANSPLVVTSDGVGSRETFELVTLPSKMLALKSIAKGTFVCAERAGTSSLVANRSVAADWESFILVPQFPMEHGFRFENTFKSAGVADVTVGGLCGGMSYAALDVTSLTSNLVKWAEVEVNPGGAGNLEFFNWGLSVRIDELRASRRRHAMSARTRARGGCAVRGRSPGRGARLLDERLSR